MCGDTHEPRFSLKPREIMSAVCSGCQKLRPSHTTCSPAHRHEYHTIDKQTPQVAIMGCLTKSRFLLSSLGELLAPLSIIPPPARHAIAVVTKWRSELGNSLPSGITLSVTLRLNPRPIISQKCC